MSEYENIKFSVIRDFRDLVIVERIGQKVERIDNDFSGGTYPTGESGLVDFYRRHSGGTQP